ncbi:MAG: Rne/Rng family ribonuclease, partial [Candidatus Binatia bacterium]|nr:Rne/Rng family ribonuclease [Candidatus Binatia bacterium]
PGELSSLLAGADEIIFERSRSSSRRRVPIERQLSPGQEVLVQVAKDPLGQKGARLTSHISLPGRYLVFMPTMRHVGVSHRIEDEEERKRLKEIVQSLLRDEGGFILRTACEGRSKREIRDDFRFLTKLWKQIQKKAETSSAPFLIHQDLDLVMRAIRDFCTADTAQVMVDEAREHRRIVEFVGQFMPRLKSKVTHFNRPEPILEHFGIEDKIRKALETKIWLPSGGHITIDQTEALTAIDVNTGRYVGKKNQEDTIFKINLEAAQEVVRQLRLRNIGGIIIIDFIDMERAGNRKKVYDVLKEAIKKDRAKTNILQISELGLVEMTRQRTRENLGNQLLSPCPYCDGRGKIKSHATIAFEILRGVKKHKANLKENGERILVRVHPEIANFLYDEANQSLEHLEREIHNKIIIKVSQDLHQEQYEISAV